MPPKHTLVFQDFNISYEETKNGWEMPYSHFHSHYEIYILLSGNRTVTIGDRSYSVSSGYATLFSKNIPHHSSGTTDFSGICIHFSGNFLSSYLKSEAINQLMQCFNSPVIFLPEDYCNHLLTMTKHFTPNDSGNYLLLAQILHHMNLYQTKYTKETPTQSPTFNDCRKNQILEYIHNHYTSISTVSEISTALSISEAYVYQVVKANTSMTPKQYINYLRIRHAMHELEYSNRNLPLIQELCGFHSLSYFVRVFKLQTGMTPTEFRKQLSSVYTKRTHM